MNFTKSDSLFNYGMKISVYSQKAAADAEQPVGWNKDGNEISYYANGIRKNHYFTGKCYYTLKFEYEF